MKMLRTVHKFFEVSFFKSAKSAAMLTLDEYIDAFAEGQEEIYYLSVEDPALALAALILKDLK